MKYSTLNKKKNFKQIYFSLFSRSRKQEFQTNLISNIGFLSLVFVVIKMSKRNYYAMTNLCPKSNYGPPWCQLSCQLLTKVNITFLFRCALVETGNRNKIKQAHKWSMRGISRRTKLSRDKQKIVEKRYSDAWCTLGSKWNKMSWVWISWRTRLQCREICAGSPNA